LLEKTI